MSGAQASDDRIGPEILPGTPEYAWVERVVAAVERRTGRPSRWNRQLFEDTRFGYGGAIADGPMLLHRASILDPVMTAYETTRPLADEEIVAARSAVYAVVHEAIHLLSDPGDDSAPDAVEQGSAEDMALEEALADTAAAEIEAEIVRDIGLDRAVPRILDLRLVNATYAAENQILAEAVHDLSAITGQEPDAIRSTIHQTPRAQRFNAMADLVIDHRLHDLMPADHRDQLRARLGEPIRAEFRGERPALDVNGRLAEIETHYRGWYDANPGTTAEPPRMPMSPDEQTQLYLIKCYAAELQMRAVVADLQRFLGSSTAPGATAMPQTAAAATEEAEARSAAAGATSRPPEAEAGPGGGTAAGGGAGPGGRAAAGGGAAGAPAAYGKVLPFRRDRSQER